MIENVTVSVTENGELENMDSRVGTQVGRSLSAVKVTKILSAVQNFSDG